MCLPQRHKDRKSYRQVSSLAQLQQHVLGASCEPALAALLINAEAREALRQVLIETYFAPEVRPALFQCGKVASAAAAYRQEIVRWRNSPLP